VCLMERIWVCVAGLEQCFVMGGVTGICVLDDTTHFGMSGFAGPLAPDALAQ
jgi:hypothetical protein